MDVSAAQVLAETHVTQAERLEEGIVRTLAVYIEQVSGVTLRAP